MARAAVRATPAGSSPSAGIASWAVGWGTIDAAIRAYLGRRPVYLVPPDWEAARLLAVFRTRPVETYGGYTDIVEVLP